MKAMEKNIRANDYRSILNFFRVISELRIIESDLRDYIIKVSGFLRNKTKVSWRLQQSSCAIW